jgi:hypothetical protein
MLATMTANLVSNAVKYTDRGGVLLGCRVRGDWVAIEVYDTGPGVPADRQEVIFEAFRQLNDEREGLGLGLSIVRQTAEVLGCRVRLRSVVGRAALRGGRPACRSGAAREGAPTRQRADAALAGPVAAPQRRTRRGALSLDHSMATSCLGAWPASPPNGRGWSPAGERAAAVARLR